MNEESGELTVLPDTKDTIWTPAFIRLFFMNAALNFGQFMASSIIPMYTGYLGASAAIIGFVSSTFAITALAVRPVVGPSTQYYSKNRLLAAATSILLAAFVLYSMASSVDMMVIGRILHGVGMGFLAPVVLAMASDALPNKKMAAGIGIFTLGQALATALGPLIGLELVRAFGYRTAFLTGAVLVGIVTVMALRLHAEPPVRQGRLRITMRDVAAPEVLIPAVMMFFLAGANGCVQAFVLIYGGLAGVYETGLFFTANAICLLFTRPFVGSIADRYGMDRVIVPSILIFALSFVVLSYARTLPMFLLAGAISAFGYGVSQPALQTLGIKLVDRTRRGVASNTNYIGVDAGYLATPAVAGLIITLVQARSGSEIAGYAEMFRYMTIPILIAGIIYLWKRKSLTARMRANDAVQSDERPMR